MTGKSLRELDIAKAFLLFAPGSVAGGFLAAAVAGMLWGLLVAATDGNLADVRRGAAILGGVAGLLVSYFMFRVVTLKFIAPRLANPARQNSGESAV